MTGINIWMQLLGFDKNDADRGAMRFINQVGFVCKKATIIQNKEPQGIQ